MLHSVSLKKKAPLFGGAVLKRKNKE